MFLFSLTDLTTVVLSLVIYILLILSVRFISLTGWLHLFIVLLFLTLSVTGRNVPEDNDFLGSQIYLYGGWHLKFLRSLVRRVKRPRI